MSITQPQMKEQFISMLELNKDILREARATNSNDMSELIDTEALLKIVETILLPYGHDFCFRFIKERRNQISYNYPHNRRRRRALVVPYIMYRILLDHTLSVGNGSLLGLGDKNRATQYIHTQA